MLQGSCSWSLCVPIFEFSGFLHSTKGGSWWCAGTYICGGVPPCQTCIYQLHVNNITSFINFDLLWHDILKPKTWGFHLAHNGFMWHTLAYLQKNNELNTRSAAENHFLNRQLFFTLLCDTHFSMHLNDYLIILGVVAYLLSRSHTDFHILFFGQIPVTGYELVHCNHLHGF